MAKWRVSRFRMRTGLFQGDHAVQVVQDFFVSQALHGNHAALAAFVFETLYFFHQTVFHHFIYALVDAGVEFFPVVIQDEVSEVIGGCFFPLFFVVVGNAFAGELIVFQGANDALDIVGMDFFGGFRIYGGQTGVKGFGAFSMARVSSFARTLTFSSFSVKSMS